LARFGWNAFGEKDRRVAARGRSVLEQVLGRTVKCVVEKNEKWEAVSVEIDYTRAQRIVHRRPVSRSSDKAIGSASNRATPNEQAITLGKSRPRPEISSVTASAPSPTPATPRTTAPQMPPILKERTHEGPVTELPAKGIFSAIARKAQVGTRKTGQTRGTSRGGGFRRPSSDPLWTGPDYQDIS
jgi:hypothetical protein